MILQRLIGCRPSSRPYARNSVRNHCDAVDRNKHLSSDEAQKQASSYASQTQALFDRFAADERLLQGDVGDVSVDLMTVPARDEERQRLEARFKELDDERKKFTEAAVRLGREKAALEVRYSDLASVFLLALTLIIMYRQNASSFWKRNALGKSS